MKFWKPSQDERLIFLNEPLTVGASYFQDKDGNLEMRELSIIAPDDGFVRGKSTAAPIICEQLPTPLEKIHLNAINIVDSKLQIMSLPRALYEGLVAEMKKLELLESQKKAAARFKASKSFYRGRLLRTIRG